MIHNFKANNMWSHKFINNNKISSNRKHSGSQKLSAIQDKDDITQRYQNFNVSKTNTASGFYCTRLSYNILNWFELKKISLKIEILRSTTDISRHFELLYSFRFRIDFVKNFMILSKIKMRNHLS